MRITLDIDTDRLTARDLRILSAITSPDARPTVYRDANTGNLATDTSHLGVPEHATTPPSPTPAPPAFMQRLGEAVQQFGPSASSRSDARLPVAQQAGVRTRSTDDGDESTPDAVPDDDGDQGLYQALAVPAPVSVSREDVERSESTVIEDIARAEMLEQRRRDVVASGLVTPNPPAEPMDLVEYQHASPLKRQAMRAANITTNGPTDTPVRHTTP